MGEIVSGVNVMTKFCKPGDDAYGEYIDYMNRTEAVRNKYIDKYNLYNDYMGNPQKTDVLFTDNKDSLTKEETKELKEIFKKAQGNGSLMWQTVISFDNRWLEEQGVYKMESQMLDDKKIMEVTRKGINKMLEKEGLENATWSAAIHYNTDNIHVHVATVELFPQRKTKIYDGKEEYVGRFKGKSIQACKSTVVNELMLEKDLNILINDVIRQNILKQKEIHPVLQDPDLVEAFLKLYNAMPDCPRNKWMYANNIMSNIRPQIDSVTDLYLRKYHMEDMQKLDKMLKEQSQVYRTSYGKTKRDYRISKFDDLYRRMGNQILKEMRELDERVQKEPEFINEIITEKKLEEDFLSKPIKVEPLLYTEFDLEQENIDVDILAENFVDPHGKVYLDWTEEYKAAKNIIYTKDRKIDKSKLPKRFELMEREYKKGNVLAAYELGEYYKWGKGCEVNPEKSFYYYREALEGFELIRDKLNSEEIHTKETKNKIKDDYISYRIGKHYSRGLGTEVDEKKAFKYFTEAAEQGNIYAAYSLGNMYKNGRGVEKDTEEALFWYEFSANHNKKKEMPFAAFEAARFYQDGIGTEKDIEKAEILYKKALLGFENIYKLSPDDSLEYRIGMMYFKGFGTEKNLDTAKEFLELSSEAGNIYASYQLFKLYQEKGMGFQDEAIKHLRKVADKGEFSFAECALANIYLDKESEYFNPEEAEKYFQKAIEKEDEWAYYNYGKNMINSEMPFYDMEKGITYLEKAADMDNEWANYSLGKLYTDEKMSFCDMEKGIGCLKKAASKNNEWANYSLGKLYTDENMSFYDMEKGIEYLEKAIEKGNDFSKIEMAKIYLKPNTEWSNPEKGIEYLESIAEKNDFIKYKLGMAYLNKELSIYDPENGINYLESIKEKNNAVNYKIAKSYLDEELSIYDPQKGFPMMLRLADEGNEYAQLKIGIEYLKGRYVPKDKNLSMKYIKASAEQGNEFANILLENINAQKNYKINFMPRKDILADLNKVLKELKSAMGAEYDFYRNMYEYEEMLQLNKNMEME